MENCEYGPRESRRVCLLFLKRIFQLLCNLRFPGHIGLGVKIGTEEQKQTVIFWVDFLYHAPGSSHVCECRPLAFSALTAQLIPGSCNDLLKRQQVLCLAPTPKADHVLLCPMLSDVLRETRGG